MIPFAQALANHLWQSTLFAGFTGMLTLALRTNHARTRHALWLAASVKFLIPFSLLVAIGGSFSWQPTRSVPARLPVVMEEISQPFSPASTLHSLPGASRPAPVLTLLSIWACGFGALIFYWCFRWLRIRAIMRGASSLGTQSGIEIMSCQTLVEPGVFGVLRPVLLLPEGILNRLTPGQLKAILAHECCHAHRRDNLTTMLHMAVEAIFWFHPLVWWIGARLIAERERACDEAVLSQGSEPVVYAEGILQVCRFYLESPLVCFAGIGGSNLKQRVEDIMAKRIGRRLSFERKLLLGALTIAAVVGPALIGLLNAPRSFAQLQSGSAAGPAFEVASVKPNKSGERGASLPMPVSGRLTARNVSLRRLMSEAYHIQAFQITGPAWLDSERFDILAKAEGKPTYEQMMPMLQALLVDRFRMKTHRETKELPLYALVIAKGGPKIHKADGECPAAPDGKFPCGGFNIRRGGLLTGNKVTISQMTQALGFIVNRTVTDKTGLNGIYDIDVRWTGDEFSQEPGASPAPTPDSSGPSLFSALQEQLGLKLEAQKGPVEFIVVDHAERVPSEN